MGAVDPLGVQIRQLASSGVRLGRLRFAPSKADSGGSRYTGSASLTMPSACRTERSLRSMSGLPFLIQRMSTFDSAGPPSRGVADWDA